MGQTCSLKLPTCDREWAWPGATATPASRTRQLNDLLTRLGQHTPIASLSDPAARSPCSTSTTPTAAEDASDFVKIDRWCLTSPEDRRQLLDAYWRQRAQPADPRLEQRLTFHRLVIHLSYFLYWHGRDPTQIPGCTAALRDELE
ncbi:hypothetical protein OG618_08525 [Kitasatospora sp. NBC_01246]|uniref:hypothetical protein n=1 Tax=Kitasatospora sp. NBC_01246 TaxID=2903570 RepID=UPI002E34508A|nr:hypothetical protein [Kitasatospora sp. NBC_01246]